MMRGEMRAAGVERAYKVKRVAGRVVGGLGAAVERMVIVGQNRRGVLKKNRGGGVQKSRCVEARCAPKT